QHQTGSRRPSLFAAGRLSSGQGIAARTRVASAKRAPPGSPALIYRPSLRLVGRRLLRRRAETLRPACWKIPAQQVDAEFAPGSIGTSADTGTARAARRHSVF